MLNRRREMKDIFDVVVGSVLCNAFTFAFVAALTIIAG
jgi:hypothetical protein